MKSIAQRKREAKTVFDTCCYLAEVRQEQDLDRLFVKLKEAIKAILD